MVATILVILTWWILLREWTVFTSESADPRQRVGLIMTDEVDKPDLNINVVLNSLKEDCGIEVDIITKRERGMDLIGEIKDGHNFGLVSMAACDVRDEVAFISQELLLQNVVLHDEGCPIREERWFPRVYHLSTKPAYIYSALAELIQGAGWTVVNIIYDESQDLDSMQRFLSVLGERHILYSLVRLPVDMNQTISVQEALKKMEIIERNIKVDCRRRCLTKNVLTLVGFENVQWLIQMALERDLMKGPTYMWMVLGVDLRLLQPDLKALMDSNILIITTDMQDTESFRLDSDNYNFHVATRLILATTLVSELSHPGILNLTSHIYTSGCSDSLLQLLPSIKRKATWIAEHKNTLFDEDGYRTDVLIKAWGPPSPVPTTTTSNKLKTNNNFITKANWTLASGLEAVKEDFYIHTFSNFNGRTIRVAVYEARPFVIKRSYDNGTVYFEGLCITMLKEIANLLNFRYAIEEPPDEMYGKYDNLTKRWKGMIGMLHRQEVHLAVGPFTVSEQRARAVDFTTAFMEDQGGFAVHRPQMGEVSAFRVFQPFSVNVWLTLAGSVVCVGAILFCVDHVVMYSKRDPEVTYGSLWKMIAYLWMVYGDVLEQNSDVNPRTSSARVLIVIWWLFTIIFTSMYTANLAAVFTVHIEPRHINTLEEVIENPDVQPMVQPGSFLGDIFKESNEGSILHEVSERIDQFDQPKESSKALQIVRQSDHYVFMSDRSQLQYDVTKDCKNLVLAREKFGPPSTFAFPVTKDSSLLPALNLIIRRFQESGLMDQWYSQWWVKDRVCHLSESHAIPSSVEIWDLIGAFFLLVVVSAAAFIALLLEIIINKNNSERNR